MVRFDKKVKESIGLLPIILALSTTFFLHPKEVGTKSMASEKELRKAAVAGSFYPADPAQLKKQIDDLLTRVGESRPEGRILALVSPHAGYVYSGQVAAYAYKLLKATRTKTVIIISPSHTEYFPFASVFTGSGYETPLGVVPVDQVLAREIASKSELVKASDKGHMQSHLPRQEHSLEVQLPFLQRVLPSFRIVPIVVGEQSWNVCEALGKTLAPYLKREEVILVASSDLSHFHPDEKARKLDGVFCSLLEEMDPRALHDGIKQGRCEACGAAPVVATLVAAKAAGANECRVLKTANSGDVTGDRSSVVGYASAVILVVPPPRGEGKKENSSKSESSLSPEERSYLLKLARYAIAEELGVEEAPIDKLRTPNLERKSGAFVTLKIDGKLRGCIGYIQAIKPLCDTIFEMARAAAFQDPRFPPLTEEEFGAATLEISVLSPLRPISNPEEITVGLHGLVVDRGLNRGLLLPQVATEYNWDRLTFLEHTCLKASLPQDAWKDEDTKIYVFSAEVFGESKTGK